MPDLKTTPSVFERGEHVYIVGGSVQVITPTDEEITEYAFAQAIAKQAPNPNIVWLQGQYVEAEQPNLNGAQWSSEELAIKSLTPMMMPVTVMHDPRTAVGVIADAKLLTPDADNVPRSKIITTLGLWSHRFPEAVEETVANATKGTLMQSMECMAPDYSCSVCGMNFVKMPGGFERENWCSHLKASNPSGGYVAGDDGVAQNASRILGNVVFTGTGLIFGTRGARGADPEAHLEVFQEEVAGLHESWHTESAKRPKRDRRTSQMPMIEIEQSEYDRLKASEAKLAPAEQAKAAAEKEVETVEADKIKVTEERDALKAERDGLQEQARAGTLKDKRLGDLGDGFTAKLGEKTTARLQEQAAKLTDDEWAARLEELAELVGVKPDAKKDGDEPTPEAAAATAAAAAKGDVFTEEELASARFGSEPEDSGEPTKSQRSGVMRGLMPSKRAAAKADAKS